MNHSKKQVVIIGGGPAGLAAAIAAKKSGCTDVLLIERDFILGGILNQCIHDGFGLHEFKEALSGPEYADRFIKEFHSLGIEVMTGTIVLSMNADRVIDVSTRGTYKRIQADAIVLGMGCRERTAGAISLPGTRPSGVFTAGSAQNFMNLQNIMVGKQVVVLGSGDIGLIMARRMTLEGAKVEAVFEILPYSSGLPRNIQQCLNDYEIPLFLKYSVIDIHGKDRITGVTVAEIGADRNPLENTKRFVPCDTLLLSVGLIPENELSRSAGVKIYPKTSGAFVDETYMTSIPGIFACGNVLHVHDLVDHVSAESYLAGRFASEYALGQCKPSKKEIPIETGKGIRYVLPQKISGEKDFVLSMRVVDPSRNQTVMVKCGENIIAKKKMVRLHPAEMIRMDIKAEKIGNATRLEVSVE